MRQVENIASPVIIDTDGGVDDALAIIMALRSPHLDLKALTVVAGNIDAQQAAENLFRVASLVPGAGPTTIAKGCEKPLAGPSFDAAGIHGEDGLGELDRFLEADGSRRYPEIEPPISGEHGVDILLAAARRYGKSLKIVALGPLTNIASAIRKDAEAMKNVGEIVIMGGAVTVPGNITPAAEFNFFVDPEAAQIVLQSDAPLVLVGLDVAMKAPLARSVVDVNMWKHPSPLAQLIADCSEVYMAFYRDHEGFHGCYLHDPLAVGVAIDRSLVRTESLFVVVETEGASTRGMSLADLRARRDEAGNPPNVDVCLDVDTERFFWMLNQLLW